MPPLLSGLQPGHGAVHCGTGRGGAAEMILCVENAPSMLVRRGYVVVCGRRAEDAVLDP